MNLITKPGLIAAFVAVFPIVSIASNPCDLPVLHPSFNLKLVAATAVGENEFDGEFELANSVQGPPLHLYGIRSGKRLRLFQDQSRIEARNLNGGWDTLLTSYGDIFVEPDEKVVKPGAKTRIVVTLPTRKQAQRSADELRLLIWFTEHDICIVSQPFIAWPPRSPATGFRSK